MGERKRIGIVYLYDKSWLGGVYYIQNLLIALNTLNDDKKFAIDLYCLNDDSFNDLKLLQEQKSFFVLCNDNSLTFGIKKQIGIQDDIIFPLVQKSSDIKEVVDELCKKNNELEKKVNDLNEKVNQLENDLKMIKDAFVLDSSDENVIKDFFDKKPKAFKLIYNGKDRNYFFC